MTETIPAPGKKAGNTSNLRKGGGRPKGAPNKINGDIRNMIATALNEAGGVDYLIERAHDPKTSAAFLGLVGKILPKEVVADVALKAEIRWPIPAPRIES